MNLKKKWSNWWKDERSKCSTKKKFQGKSYKALSKRNCKKGIAEEESPKANLKVVKEVSKEEFVHENGIDMHGAERE